MTQCNMATPIDDFIALIENEDSGYLMENIALQ
jgi:hypothetical protein